MANAQPALDAPPSPPSGELQATGTLDIKDSRTSKNYSVQIIQGGVEGDTATRAMDLRQIKTAPDEFGATGTVTITVTDAQGHAASGFATIATAANGAPVVSAILVSPCSSSPSLPMPKIERWAAPTPMV